MSATAHARHQGTKSLAVKIALRGGQKGASTFVADWEPYCENPVTINRRITSREAVPQIKIGGTTLQRSLSAMEVTAAVPCRRCPGCLRWRQMKWRERAMIEINRANSSGNRTWFVTLTFAPQHLAGILLAAKSAEMKDIEKAAYLHVQLYLRRLRHHSHEFRYLAVYERGEVTGRSHYHLFLHETGAKPITKVWIERMWRSHVHARLVSCDDGGRTASYLTKYTTKSFDIRPRASARYGKPLSLKI